MKSDPYKAQAPPRLLIDFIIIRTQMSKADIKQSIIKRGNCLWEIIDSVTRLQSREAPHGLCRQPPPPIAGGFGPPSA